MRAGLRKKSPSPLAGEGQVDEGGGTAAPASVSVRGRRVLLWMAGVLAAVVLLIGGGIATLPA